jgi:DmsE family decaheme c-type cytochrome
VQTVKTFRAAAKFIRLIGLLGFFLSFHAVGQTTSQKSEYVGSTVCRTCHSHIWNGFYKNPHSRSIASGKETPENTGCEGCHGPGGAHVKAFGGKATVVSFSQLTPRQSLDACLRCHATSLNRANIHSSPHTLNNVACVQCHSIHKPATPKALLASAQPELCYSCHSNTRADFSMPFKHRVNEGFMACSDCHNPHGTFPPTWRSAARPALVRQSLSNEEACLKCHVDKRGPFAFEHPPVQVEGCEMCHSPHGSTNSRLLRRPVVFTLCLECHNGAGTFGRTLTGVPRLSQAHNMADPRYQNCTNCHVRIHGSNSDPLFLR